MICFSKIVLEIYILSNTRIILKFAKKWLLDYEEIIKTVLNKDIKSLIIQYNKSGHFFKCLVNFEL